MLRKVTLAAILAGAVGVPYAIWKGDEASDSIGTWWNSSSDQAAGAAEETLAATPTAHSFPQSPRSAYDPTAFDPTMQPQFAPGGAMDETAATLTGPTVTALAEVLNMNVTQQWVSGRWSRVTTTLADTRYDGLRVPFVSGTRPTDVTGSLTYYFDRQQTLQRITFHGSTGDPQQVIELLAGHMEFEKQKSLGGELYTRVWLGRTTSVCRIRPAGVLHAGAASSRYEVLLELNRAQWKSNLSEAGKALLN